METFNLVVNNCERVMDNLMVTMIASALLFCVAIWSMFDFKLPSWLKQSQHRSGLKTHE